MKPLPFKYISCIILLGITGCTLYSQTAVNQSQNEDRYTSSFPTRDVSATLQNIQRSVLRLTSTTIYDIFSFEDQNVTMDDIDKRNIKETATSSDRFDETKAGTAIAILENKQHIAFITANHILTTPDTLINYSLTLDDGNRKVVKSIAIKVRQFNYLHTNNKLFSIDVLAANQVDDIALFKIAQSRDVRINPIALKTGRAYDLKLGSFLYVMGFPLGSPMVSRGIASAPNYDNNGTFLTDALFNHGISGGLIIASRDNFNSFEWVGMAVTASASNQFFLVPDPNHSSAYENFEPYNDTPFIEKRELINYGVTQATPIEKILRFLRLHEQVLNSYGFRSINIGQ